jgi:hypothetical protein
MTRLARYLVAALIVAAVPATASADSVSAIVGIRDFEEEDDLYPSDRHDFFLLQYEIVTEAIPVSVNLGLQMTSEDNKFFSGLGTEFSREISVMQLDLGMVKVWEKYTYLRPYVGGGFSIVNLEDETTNIATGVTISDDDITPGLFFNGGVYARLGERLNIGVDARILRLADLDLEVTETDANSFQLGLLVGWRFGDSRSTPPAEATEPPEEPAADFEDEFLLDDEPDETEPDDSTD